MQAHARFTESPFPFSSGNEFKFYFRLSVPEMQGRTAVWNSAGSHTSLLPFSLTLTHCFFNKNSVPTKRQSYHTFPPPLRC